MNNWIPALLHIERWFMYITSEYVACVALAFALSAFLFAFCLVFVAIKDGLENRRGTSCAFQPSGTLFGARLATVMARHKESSR